MNGDDELDQETIGAEPEAGVMPTEPSAPPISVAPPPVAPPPMAAPVAAPAPAPAIQRMFLMERQMNQRRQEEEWTRQLVENSRVEDAQKAVEMAIRFQALRAFGREVESSVAAGMPHDAATARAAARYPAAFGSGAGAAAFIRAVAPPPEATQIPVKPGNAIQVGGRVFFPPTSMFPGSPQLQEQTIGGTRYAVGPKGAFQRIPESADVVARRNLLLANLKDLNRSINDARLFGSSAKPGSAMARGLEEMRKEKADLEQQLLELGGGPEPAAAAAPAAPVARPAPAPAPPVKSTAGAPGPDYVFNNEADARAAGKGKGDVVRIKGVGKVRLK